MNVPKDDGSDKDDWTKKNFNGAMYAVEASNNGFRWDWNEKTLEGKTVGVLFRNFEWEVNGKTGWSTECGMLIPAEDARTGNFKPMKDRPLKNKASERPEFPGTAKADDNADLPF